MRATDPRVTSTVALCATSLWLGGILVLGAIVAPIVFTAIPRLEAADAMTLVFQRFDLVAAGSVAVILATEAWRALGATGQRSIGRLDVLRMLVAAIGAALVLSEALWITPAIVTLHRHGAIRGLGADGLELERMHALAEACGKVQVLFALALIALHVTTVQKSPLGAELRDAHEKLLGGGATHGT